MALLFELVRCGAVLWKRRSTSSLQFGRMISLSQLCLESLATSLSQSSLNDDLSALSVLNGDDSDAVLKLLADKGKLSKRRVMALCSSQTRRIDLHGADAHVPAVAV